MKTLVNSRLQRTLSSLLLPFILLSPVNLYAQGAVLEEVVVTAQRREQSLQDVPISIETFSGDDITAEGFRNLDQLATYAPGLIIETSFELQGVSIRGMGTQSKNLNLEQATPIFMDGIHFGRVSQIRGTFMDVERMEIMRGPQPIFFGQNARAGAISVITRKPTPTWEANVFTEVGNNDRMTFEVGAGGPITDTLGIRVAGRFDKSDGYMRDIITDDKFPHREMKVGRVMLQWTPNENFSALAKFEMADQQLGERSTGVALPSTDLSTLDLRDANNLLAVGTNELDFDPIPTVAGDFTALGISRTGPFIPPLQSTTNANVSSNTGVYDFTRFQPGDLAGFIPESQVSDYQAAMYSVSADQVPVESEFIDTSFKQEHSTSKPWHALLDMNYTLNNGVEINSTTGFSRAEFVTMRGRFRLFPTNPRLRKVDFSQWSSELRLTSPAGGMFEWMAGLYWQNNDLDVNGHTWRANSRRGIRGNYASEDAEWLSGFAAVTYNFLENKASLDLGARITDINKEGHGLNYAGNWVLEDPDTGDLVAPPRNLKIIGDPTYGKFHTLAPVGRTPLRIEERVEGTFNDTSFDPQVVLRYRPTDTISTFAKWAQAYKSGGFDGGVSEVPARNEDFVFGPEEAETWEVGAKGRFLNGRANANLSVFWTTVSGMQVSAIDRTIDRNRTVNAAKKRSRGIEFSGRMAVDDRLTMGFSVALLDSEFLSFPGAPCFDAEVQAGLCEVTPAGAIRDRSGTTGRNAADWQGTLDANYRMPVMNNYQVTLQGLLSYTDDYVTARDFNTEIYQDPDADMNLSVSFGNLDDSWNVKLWGRNLLESRQAYDPASDLDPQDILLPVMSPRNFASYGISFNYKYR